MTKDKPQKTPLGFSVRGVVVRAGGPEVVAHAIGVSHQSVRNWLTVPAKHAETVAQLAGLPLAVVRPELASKALVRLHEKKQ
jgi:hypothetical protein